MIDLNKFYISKKYTGPSGAYPSAGGFVPPATINQANKFLGGNGLWTDPTISAIQYIENSNNIVLDVANYSTFVVNLTESATFTYSGFENGKTINVYLVANHAGHIPHTFPPNTVFAELGDDNVIYSFANFTTRLLLQDIGNYVYNFSSVVRTPINPYYYYNNPIAGIGIDLLDLYLNS